MIWQMYEWHTQTGTFYVPPLNVVGPAWVILGLSMILAGDLFVGAGVVRSLRKRGVWVLGFATYLAFSILSIAQIWRYSAAAVFVGGGILQLVGYSGREETLGLYGAIIGLLVVVYLLIPSVRTFFSREAVQSNAHMLT